MFDRLVHRFLNKIFEPKPPIHTVPKKVVYFCLPFTGSHSLQIRTQINRLCNAAYPHLNIQFIFRSSKRISSFSPFKDKVPTFLRSGVVYLFKCRCCSASYVGQTMRHLYTRVSEHRLDDFKILSSCLDTCELLIHESLFVSKLKPTLNVQGSSIPLNLL